MQYTIYWDTIQYTGTLWNIQGFQKVFPRAKYFEKGWIFFFFFLCHALKIDIVNSLKEEVTCSYLRF